MAEGEVRENDPVLQSTCEEIVTLIAQAIDAEPEGNRSIMRLPDGGDVGRQIMIDASDNKDVMNRCRISILNAETAPDGEVARIEYEHDKQGKFESRRVYSIQSVRRRGGELVLLENFLATGTETVREADFKAIKADAYAKMVVLKSVRDWTKWRAWQLQESGKKK